MVKGRQSAQTVTSNSSLRPVAFAGMKMKIPKWTCGTAPPPSSATSNDCCFCLLETTKTLKKNRNHAN